MVIICSIDLQKTKLKLNWSRCHLVTLCGFFAYTFPKNKLPRFARPSHSRRARRSPRSSTRITYLTLLSSERLLMTWQQVFLMVATRSKSTDSRPVASITWSIWSRERLASTAKFRKSCSRRLRFTPRSSIILTYWDWTRFKRVSSGSLRWLKRLQPGSPRCEIKLATSKQKSPTPCLSSNSSNRRVEKMPIYQSNKFLQGSSARSEASESRIARPSLVYSRLHSCFASALNSATKAQNKSIIF